MARNYSSVASEKTLSSTITNTATQITLNNITGLPTPPYTLVIAPDTSNEEIITVDADQTGVTAPTLKVTRGQDGSTAPVAGHASGTTVRHMITARDLQEPQNHIDNTTTAHGASGGVVGRTNTQTLTNKTIDLASNTVTGTLAQFNTALSGTNFVSTDGSETLTNKTLTSPTVSGLYLSDSSVVFEGSSADAFETTLTVTNPTADRTVTIPDVTGNVVTTGDTGTVATGMIADGAITSAKILDGTIMNIDVSSSAAIAQEKIYNLTTDLAAKAPSANPTFTGTVVLPSTTSIGDVSNTEIAMLDGSDAISTTKFAYNLSTPADSQTSTNVTVGTTRVTVHSLSLSLTEQSSVLLIANISMNVSASANVCYFGFEVTGDTTIAYSNRIYFGNTNGYFNGTLAQVVTLNSGTNNILLRGQATGSGTWTFDFGSISAVPIKALA